MSSESEEKTAKRAPEAIWADRYGGEIVHVVPHENLENYRPGGFHPIELDDTIRDGRYKIRHKLGHGGSSIVWLARDVEMERWVSIKIKQARISTLDVEDDPEIKVLKVLEERYEASPQDKPRCFTPLLDCFHLGGPNGTHNCLVTEVLGPSVDLVNRNYHELLAWDDNENWEAATDKFYPDTILRASRQLLEAIQFVHDAGLVHGDIAPGNVVFTYHDLPDSEEELLEFIGEPKVVEYKGEEPRSSHLPKHLISTVHYGAWFDEVWEDIRLIDWHGSFPITETRLRRDIPQVNSLRSPETFFFDSLDYRHDLWGAGCMIFILFFQRTPFGWGYSDADYIERVFTRLGPLPLSWQAKFEEIKAKDIGSRWASWTHENRPFEKEFEPRRQAIIEKMEEYEYAHHRSDFPERDYEALKSLLDLMKALLRYKPDARPSISEALSYIGWVDHVRESARLDEEAASFSTNEDCNSASSQQ